MDHSFLRLSPLVIEGIGETWAGRLAEVGVATIADLLRAGPDGLRRRLPTLRLTTATAWVEAARLLQVEGVDPDVAEALTRAGIGSVRELGDASLRTVERALKVAHEERRIREVPSLYELAAMQCAAARLVDTGMVGGRVLDRATGAPMAGVEVRAGRHATTTDEVGTFYLLGVRDGPQALVGALEEWPVFDARVEVHAARLGPALEIRAPRPDPSRYTPRREIDGAYVIPSIGSRLRIVTRTLDAVPEGAHLVVQEITRSGRARLVNLYRTRVGPMVFVDRVYVEAARLPEGTRVKSVLLWSGGALHPTDLTSFDVAMRKLERLLPAGRGPVARAAVGVAASSAAENDDVPKMWRWVCDDDACDECQGKEGIHVQDDRPQSHPDCRCTIEKLPWECHKAVENVEVQESEQTDLTTEHVENCDSDDPLPIYIVAYANPSDDLDSRLKAAAEEEGWTPPVMGELEAEFEIPAHAEAEYKSGTTRVSHHISGMLVLRCHTEDEFVRVELDQLHGTYSVTTELVLESLEVEECKEHADPPPLP